ncbi:MAG: energy transducer TonB [Bacteroidetes bacterium]|nr:energy transducer TonB [Bacteroidota bacterium]
MKNIKLTLLLLLVSTILFSQDSVKHFVAYNSLSGNKVPGSDIKSNLSFGVRGAYKNPVTKAKLNSATKLDDICEGYPANWLNNYVSTEIVSTSNGKKVKASGLNGTLTSEQKKIVSSVDLGAEVLIDVKYKSQNSATDKTEIRTMSFSVTVVPDVEANFKGGKVQMKQYMKEKVIDNIPSHVTSSLRQAMVKFTVNEEGEIINARVSESTGDQDIDRLMLEGVNKMPKWIPAKNSSGEKVKQDFEFVMANEGC